MSIEDLLDAKAPKKRKSTKKARKRHHRLWLHGSVKRINAPLLWQLGITGQEVLVAVLDTGVNYKHPDLKSICGTRRHVSKTWNFASDDNDPFDDQGHGTATVAGDGTSGQNPHPKPP